jgi:hypothetical protein
MEKIRSALSAAALTLAVITVGGASFAQETTMAGQAAGGIVDALGLRSPPEQAPDFVKDSRRDGLDYVPLAPVPEKTERKIPEEMQAVGEELDRAMAHNRRKAARVKIPN